MITEIPLETLLSIIWGVVLVMAACGVSYWAAHRPEVRSEVVNALTRPKDNSIRGNLPKPEVGRGNEPPREGQ